MSKWIDYKPNADLQVQYASPQEQHEFVEVHAPSPPEWLWEVIKKTPELLGSKIYETEEIALPTTPSKVQRRIAFENEKGELMVWTSSGGVYPLSPNWLLEVIKKTPELIGSKIYETEEIALPTTPSKVQRRVLFENEKGELMAWTSSGGVYPLSPNEGLK